MRRGGFLPGLICLLCLAAPVRAASDRACSIDQQEMQPLAALDDCSSFLQKQDLTPLKRAEFTWIRGRAYYRLQKLDLAKADFDAAYRLDSNNAEIQLSRAKIAFAAALNAWNPELANKFSQEAFDLLNDAQRIDPKNARVLGSLGHLYFASGVKGKAEEYFTRALQIDPKEVYSLQLRSDLYTENRQYDLALRDLDAIIALPPALVSRQGFVNDRGQFRDMRIAALRSRSELYQMLGRLDEAARDLNAAVAYKREAEPLVARAQFLLSREGRVTEALKDLEAAIALDPGDRYAHYTKGLALMEQKRFGDALQAFDRCLEASQGYDYCLRMRARVHRERGDTDRAVADMENAMKSPRIIAQSITALQVAGYWNSREVPESLTPALRDAVRACMLDKRCN